MNSASEETVWRAVDETGDGHADLRVRLSARSSSSGPEYDEATEHHRNDAWVCRHDVETDRWACPAETEHEWLRVVAPTVAGAAP